MSRSRKLVLLVISFVWVLLIGVGAFFTYPSIGPIATSIDPNPFWSVIATGDTSVPYRASLKTGSWFAWTLVPVFLIWVVGIVRWRRSLRRNA